MRFKKLRRLKIATYIFFVKIFVRPSKVELDANAKFREAEKKLISWRSFSGTKSRKRMIATSQLTSHRFGR